MEAYNKIVSPMYKQQEIIKSQNQQLASLRDWLLPMLMNGQVKVGETKEYNLPNETLSMVAEGG
jgi:type I restriction enzyme S subunit